MGGLANGIAGSESGLSDVTVHELHGVANLAVSGGADEAPEGAIVVRAGA